MTRALADLRGVGSKTVEKLLSLGIDSAETLLTTLPKTYLDLSSFGDVMSAEEGDFVLFRFQATQKSPLIRKNGKTTAIVTGTSDGAKVKLVFFNRDYVLSALKIGLDYRVYGKISKRKGLTAVNPQFEEESATPKLTGVLPVYRTKGEIPQQTYRNIVKDALDKIRVASVIETAAEPRADWKPPVASDDRKSVDPFFAENRSEPAVPGISRRAEPTGYLRKLSEAAVASAVREAAVCSEVTDQTETSESLKTSDQTETSEGSEVTDQTETSEGSETANQTETSESSETADRTETSEGSEVTDQTETSEGFKASDQTEASEAETPGDRTNSVSKPYDPETLPLSDALRFVHCPVTLDEAKRGAERLLLEKTVAAMLRFRREKMLAGNLRTRRYRVGTERVEVLKHAFPFSLNESQTVAIDTIIAQLQSDRLYRGVLTGDVGSGKTAVAFFFAGYAVSAGYRAVLMAPTELVAAQHFENAEKTLGKLGIRSALLTSSVKGKARMILLEKLKRGEIDFLIGTQAVLNEGAELPDLAFAIVDEQHRFGVETRNALFQKTEAGALDTLMMSATPIPRTLRLLALGEQEALTLAPRFENKRVKTRVVTAEKRDGMLRYIAENARRGGLSYLVAPRISDMEGIPTAGAEEVFRDFTARFSDVPAGLITGRMPFSEKEATARRFRAGEIKVLIATTVVEVGLDVPDADTIAVMHADRLGLASLHQLRGRVGRSGNEAYCFLYTERPEETERLKILTETEDGMRIAEADFRLRGAGELVGRAQHGADRILAGVTEEILGKAKRIADAAIL